MTSLSYDEIFSDFLGSVTDYDLASMNIDDMYGLMTEYLHKTLSQAYVRRLFSKLTMDDIVQNLNFEMAEPVDDEMDLSFTKYILSRGMVAEWLKPQVRSKLNVLQFFGGKEHQFYSQASHLTQVRELLEDTEKEMRRAIQDRGYIYNPDLKEGNK